MLLYSSGLRSVTNQSFINYVGLILIIWILINAHRIRPRLNMVAYIVNCKYSRTFSNYPGQV